MQMDGAGKTVALVVAGLALGVVTACGSTASDASGDRAEAKIAFLMPESQTLRYETKDRPAFVDKVAQLCSGCAVIYGNADGDPAKQQQQAEAALINDAKVLVIDPANSASAVAIAAQGHAMCRSSPTTD
jgi:D-xylose transport system substrate-binding protein